MMMKKTMMMKMTMTMMMMTVLAAAVHGSDVMQRSLQDDESILADARKQFDKIPIGLSERKLSNVVLPKPLSDFAIVFDDANDNVYISGGCDSPDGNVYNLDAGGIFTCSSASSQHYMIAVADLVDYNTKTQFTPLQDLPSPRYRHTAILLPLSKSILLIGGRNITDDSIYNTVDVYNITSNTWTSHMVNDEKYLLSDSTGLEYMNRAYIFGGWNGTYTAKSTSYYIEMVNNTLNYTDIADLPTRRGDLSSVSYHSPIRNNSNIMETFALVSGGFTDANICVALDTVEVYNFNTNVWTTEHDPLTIGRGDKVMVQTSYSHILKENKDIEYTQQFVYALGGERPIANICVVNATVEVGTETVPLDDVEYYNVQNDSWTLFPNSDIDVYRFRFNGFVDTNTNDIFTLGGQLAFNKNCTCFKTSDEIYIYREIFEGDSNAPPGSAPTTGTATSSSMEWSSSIVTLNFAVFAIVMNIVVML
jgi:Galactose oxidase, central domain